MKVSPGRQSRIKHFLSQRDWQVIDASFDGRQQPRSEWTLRVFISKANQSVSDILCRSEVRKLWKFFIQSALAFKEKAQRKQCFNHCEEESYPTNSKCSFFFYFRITCCLNWLHFWRIAHNSRHPPHSLSATSGIMFQNKSPMTTGADSMIIG